MRQIEHDRDRMEFFQPIRADHGIDVGKLPLQCFQNTDTHLLVGWLEQPIINAHRPAFDLANGVRSRFRRIRFFFGQNVDA